MAISIPIVSSFDNTGIQKAQRGFGKLEDDAKRASATLRRVGQAATVGFAAVGVAITGAAYAAFNFVKAAVEDEKAAALLATSLRNTTKATDAQIAATEDWITTQALATGVADDELRPAFATIARSTRDLTKAQKLLTTAQNISAATGKPLAVTAKAVSQAFAGQFGALKKLSPELNALIKSGADADEVFAALDKTFAGASATAADTTAGKFARFKIAVDELKEGVGALLLPVLGTLSRFLIDKVIPAFENFQKAVEKDGFAKTLETYVKNGFDWLVNDGIPLAAKKAGEFATAIIDYMSPRWKPLGKALLKLLKRFARWVTDTFYPWLQEEIPKAMKAFTEWFDENADALVEGTAKLVAGLALWVATEGTPAMAKLGAALLLAMFTFNASMTATIMRTLITSIGNIVGKIAEEGKKIGNALGKGITNALITELNKAIDALNSLIRGAVGVSKYLGPVGAVIGATGKGFEIDHIPMLAQGGIVSSPTLAMIGEGNGPEAVIPLSRMGEFGMGGGVNITIQTGVGDPVAIGREVKRVMDAYARRAA
jgi:hypothetical protein